MRFIALVALALSLDGAVMLGQQTVSPYEIRTFTRNITGTASNFSGTTADGLVLTNLPLSTVIHRAYASSPLSELENLPAWVRSDPYDIVITGPFSDPPEQQQLALRTLLAARLKLAAHSEIRTRPSFDLTLARPDGQLGPALQPAACSGPMTGSEVVPRSTRAVSRFPTPEEAMTRCGWSATGGTLYSGGLSMELLANWLQEQVGRPVVDRTGHRGQYSMRWAFAGDQGRTPDTRGLISRMERDLGLTLLPSITDAEVVVIDHIERPTEN